MENLHISGYGGRLMYVQYIAQVDCRNKDTIRNYAHSSIGSVAVMFIMQLSRFPPTGISRSGYLQLYTGTSPVVL